jgi:hypothetical protein
MRKLDWFLAAVVATFLVVATAIEASSFSMPGVSTQLSSAGGVGEVAVRRLVSRLPSPVLTVDPQ